MKHPKTTVTPAAPAPAPASTAGLRRYLYFTATLTGAAIMIVEILGARMLSPYVGTSHFVWTAQIAVTLVALACGYYVGGRLVDASQKLGRLYTAIFAAAVYLALTPLICAPVAYRFLTLNLALGSLCASTLLFFVPLALLAMTGPFLVRILTASVAGVGGSVGRLTAVSTLGSFAGTLLIGYVLIPFLANSLTMMLTSGALMLVCLGYWAVWRRRALLPALVAAAGGLALSAWGVSRDHLVTTSAVERFRGNSHFGMLQVVDVPAAERRYYLNDYLIQNVYDPDAKQSAALFNYMLAGLARAYVTNIHDVLCIGLGVGFVPMDFAARGARVDVVEINPAVVPVATRYFDFKPDKVRLILADGRCWLNDCTNRYDVVVLDAFLGDSVPSHLMTREAFAAVRRVLRPGGVLVINTFGELEDGRDYLAASLDKTLRNVFAEVRVHSSRNSEMFFVAGDRPGLDWIGPRNLDSVHPSLRDAAARTFNALVRPDPAHGRILTDDYNPVEFFDARNRETLRRELALSIRKL